jgi:hypothetical protein
MGKSRTSGIAKTSLGIGLGGGGGLVSGGGVSASAEASVQAQVQQNQQQNQPNQTVQTDAQDLIDASKVASVYGNNTSAMFDNMSDDDLANALSKARNVDMPNHIDDISDDTQKFTYANQLNAKPTVLSDSDFDDFLKQNNISDSQILIREVNGASFTSNGVRFNYTANDVTDMFKTSDINYIGGKRGGQVYGAGTYFGMEGRNGSTGYAGGATMMAVLNPKTARVISYNSIGSQWSKFISTRPNLAKQYGSRGSVGGRSIQALLMGYNVITTASNNSTNSRGDYYNVIDRSAVVVRANNR